MHRAFAFEEMYHVAVVVGEYLHLDMARVLEILFHIDSAIAEVFLCLARRRLELVLQ